MGVGLGAEEIVVEWSRESETGWACEVDAVVDEDIKEALEDAAT